MSFKVPKSKQTKVKSIHSSLKSKWKIATKLACIVCVQIVRKLSLLRSNRQNRIKLA